jgi:hypothetical protein
MRHRRGKGSDGGAVVASSGSLDTHAGSPLERIVVLIHALGIQFKTDVRERASERVDHMGAVLADAVLQSGMNYQSFVVPRVRLLRTSYPNATTVSALRRLLRSVGPQSLLGVANVRKCAAIWGLVDLLLDEQVETIAELKSWIEEPASKDKLLTVHGVGTKTVAFLRILLGHDGIAIDTHVRRAAAKVGVSLRSDDELAALFAQAAIQAGVRLTDIDGALWTRESLARRQGMS